MDELIEQLAAKIGVDKSVAEKAVGLILDFLRNEGPSGTVQVLIDSIPGAAEVVEANAGGGGGFGAMFGGGLMALGGKLMGLGLGMGEIQGLARELFKYGRDKIGADKIDEIIAGTPGLSQFT
jgi:hypothetical protein